MAPPGSSVVNPNTRGEPDTRRLAICSLPSEADTLSQLDVRVDLDAFLERMASTPFSDGVEDCVLTMADWVVLNGHPDPAADYRNRFHTALGCARFIKRSGGLQAVMAQGAARSGLPATASPVRGDIGLVTVRGVEVAALCLGSRWAFKSRAGLLVDSADVLFAWSV